MKKEQRIEFLLNAPVNEVLTKLTWPMMFGMIGMVVFNLVDTFFIGKLGVRELAVMGYTFPVVTFITSVSVGIGIGASSLISRTINTSEFREVQKSSVHILVLAMVVIFIFVILGQITISPLFSILGADKSQIILIRHYMEIWYWGMLFVVISMVGNNLIRGTGDTFVPGLIMVISALINGILDPAMIFGLWGFPRMEMKGAALATVISRALAMGVSLFVLYKRDRLITLARGIMKGIFDTWRKVLFVAIPATLSMLIIPISIGLITRLLSGYGKEAVAAFGVVSRVEMFSLMVLASLGSVLTFFAGQHWSLGKNKRLAQAIRSSIVFSNVWGLLIFVTVMLFSESIAGVFSDNVHVVDIASRYLRIVSLSYGFLGMLTITASTLNGINQPLKATALAVFRMFVLYVPLAFLGSELFGLNGIFYAAFTSNTIIGWTALVVMSLVIKKNHTKKSMD